MHAASSIRSVNSKSDDTLNVSINHASENDSLNHDGSSACGSRVGGGDGGALIASRSRLGSFIAQREDDLEAQKPNRSSETSESSTSSKEDKGQAKAAACSWFRSCLLIAIALVATLVIVTTLILVDMNRTSSSERSNQQSSVAKDDVIATPTPTNTTLTTNSPVGTPQQPLTDAPTDSPIVVDRAQSTVPFPSKSPSAEPTSKPYLTTQPTVVLIDPLKVDLILYDGTNRQSLGRLDGAIINSNDLASGFNVNVVIEDNRVASVAFYLDGQLASTDTEPPFFLGNSFSALGEGEHTVQAILYSTNGEVVGDVTASFLVQALLTASPTKAPIATTDAPVTTAPTAIPTAAPIDIAPPSTLTFPDECGIPKFVGGWEQNEIMYPIFIAEAQGAMIDTDFVLVSGFHDPNGGYDDATLLSYARDISSVDTPWRELDPLPTSYGITHGATVRVGTKLYICGGYQGGNPGPHSADCLVLDHLAESGNQWSRLPDLPEGRSGGGMVYDSDSNSLIFSGGAVRPVAGNRHSVDYKNTWMLSLDNVEAGWAEKADLPFVANHMGATTTKDALGHERHFFVGGQVGDDEDFGNISDNYEYFVQSDTWIKREFMPFTRGHANSSTRAFGCGFFVAGGSTNGASEMGIPQGKTSDISFYDTTTDSWTKIGDLVWNLGVNTPVCDIGIDAANEQYIFCESGFANADYSYRRKIVLEPHA